MSLSIFTALSRRHSPDSASSQFVGGAVAMLPLCVSVIPWGILAGSMAVQAGLTFWQGVGMSAIIFAGAAQLVTLGLLMSGSSAVTVLLTVMVITAQHLIYGLTLRPTIAPLAARYRLLLGFLLTDELFALAIAAKARLTTAYLIGAGLTFYLCWVACSLAGIGMAHALPNLERYHLDFSIVATFITLVVPMVKRLPVLAGTLFSLFMSMLLAYWRIEGAMMIAGLGGMALAVITARLTGETSGETS
ncbi:AzlC family ABC transporter permease [Dickeya chrysanthemi]|uniref:AzlC family ABC transporter permease n=1 Tax=Dickeya chrysanthemi TaxID=556 RepID=UPI0025A282B0|nr:AzlC family ABC transporter permease [Dickeya chrysanthemi]WJM84922.1 AzlC family ABC transporter permease [Dickeya chrysanthemi]